MACQELIGAAARRLINVMSEEVTAIMIRIVLMVSYVVITIAERISLQPEATGPAMLIVAKV